jgi:hypothetical protein
MKKDTYYFSHDYNARTDEKIKKLIRKHGMSGYGVYWAIIEDLYNNANALQLDCDGIAFDLHTDSEVVKSVIHDFDLFMFEADIFGSLSVERRLHERSQKSKKARDSANERWERYANAMQTHSEGNAIKERKGKETKENKEDNKYNFSQALLSYGFNSDLVSTWLEVRRKKKAVDSEIAFRNFISEVEKTKKDKNYILEQCVYRSWSGFKASWIDEPKKRSIDDARLPNNLVL